MTNLKKLQAALPQLEAKIKEITNVDIKLFAGEYFDNYNGINRLEITSENFADKLCGVAAPIFKTIKISTWGGKPFENNENIIYFTMNVDYEHFGGGKNGTNYIWRTLLFNLEKGAFDFGKSELIYEN